MPFDFPGAQAYPLEAMDVSTAKAHLDEAIQAASPDPGWYLSGWVLVAEWVPPVGPPVLSHIQSPNLTSWQRSGYLFDVLQGGHWDDEPDRL